jgi:TonB-linked SusC/RagA family outer membrane protein
VAFKILTNLFIMKLKSRVRIKWLDGGLRCLLVIVLMNLFVLPIFGQEVPITGIVKSGTDGTTLVGVNIRLKGTTTGTITDMNGVYSLKAESGQTLVFSYIGFENQEIEVKDQKVINVTLSEDVKFVDEVVAIGYGSVKRKDVTGSVSSVKADEIAKSNPVTIEQSLQGRVAGMVAMQTSGQPGGGMNIQVRGITSLGGAYPLFVIDGVRVKVAGSRDGGMNPLAGINPSDIESIDVLKDASATAIYGSEASDGVVLITTKRGRIAAPKISYQFSTGIQQLAKKLPVMNLREFASLINDRAVVWGFDSREGFENPQYLGEGTDWQDVLFRNAPRSEHTLTVSGGDERTQYLLSGSYDKEEGIAFGSEFKRLSFRLNLDNKTTNWLKIGTSLQLVNMDEKINSTSGDVIGKALSMTPDIAVTNSDGTWGGAYNESGWVPRIENPFAIALINKDEANRKQVYGNAYAEVTFVKGLVLRNTVGGNFSIYKRDSFHPSYKMGNLIKEHNDGSYSYDESNHTEISNYLNYTHLFANKYDLNVMAGHEAQLNMGEYVYAARKDYPSDNVQTVGSGDPATATNDGRKSQSAIESYFGRLNFTIKDKYLFTGNGRYDGNSMYNEANRWILTYSGAFAWKLNNENFLKNVTKVNELKLRLGYGLTNRPGGRDYAYSSSLRTVSTGLGGVALVNNEIGNPDLKWEQTKYGNAGLDGTFFNWRLNFAVDFYLRRTDDLAMQIALPLYSGTSTSSWPPGALKAPYVNIGSMENKGFDFRISSTNIKSKDFTWKTDLTVSHNKNKIIKLNAEGASIPGDFSKTVEGRSMGEFYGYVVEGVFANAVDFLGDEENGILPHARPVRNGEELPVGNAGGSIWYGDLKFKDLNEDGVIDERDQKFLGSPIPKVQLGLNNTFTYKNFELNAFFNASIGNKIYNVTRRDHESPKNNTSYFKGAGNYARLGLIDPEGSASDINNVYVTNPDTKIIGLRNDNTNGNDRISDLYVEDGTFLKCKSVTLSYNFSEQLLQKIHMASLRVYVTATNLFTITDYSGMDPEIGSWNPLNAGIDRGYYPQPRVFTFGVNLSLSK